MTVADLNNVDLSDYQENGCVLSETVKLQTVGTVSSYSVDGGDDVVCGFLVTVAADQNTVNDQLSFTIEVPTN